MQIIEVSENNYIISQKDNPITGCLFAFKETIYNRRQVTDMKKACPYCGRVHERNYDCGRKPKPPKRYNNKNKFRSTMAWQRKREEIKERDHYLCQVCIRNLHGTVRRLNHERLEVHHIIPLEEDEGKKLDGQNLITLCERHHEMAEQGKISRGELLAITAEIYPPGGEV